MKATEQKATTRPPHMSGSDGTVSMWTTESLEGVRRAHIRCPHCDEVSTYTPSQLAQRLGWIRLALRWTSVGRRLLP
jgi:hypothetical protein